MISGISNIVAQTPPEVAYLLGFFMALSLRRGRVEAIISRFLPAKE